MDLTYDVIRSAKRKKLTITVERDRSVVIHAPVSMTDEAVREAVESKRQWLYSKLQHPQKYKNKPAPPGKEVVNGESALYLGTEYKIEIIETQSGTIEFDQRFLVPRARESRRREVLRDWYIDRAQGIIIPRVVQCAHELGVTFTTVRVVDNRYRWGSCTVNDNINFNWRLVKAPMPVIDYVIVHELAHLIESNHTPRFWSIIRAKIPNMARAKAWLKDNGQTLEEDL